MLKNLVEWGTFINESVGEENRMLSVSDLEDYVMEFKDADYFVGIDLGYVRTKSETYYARGSWVTSEVEVFSEGQSLGKNYNAYRIVLSHDDKSLPRDLTDSLRFLIDVFKDDDRFDVYLRDDDGDDLDETLELAVDNLKVKNGFIHRIDEYDSIEILIAEKESFDVNQFELAEFYEWGGYEKDEEGMYIVMDISDLVPYFVSRGTYRDYLVEGRENCGFDDHYHDGFYGPDINSMVSYTFDKEISRSFTEYLLRENFEGVKDFINEEYDEEFETEAELIEFISRRDRYLINLIEELFKDNELLEEIQGICRDYEISAHADKNWEELNEEFDEILEEHLKFSKYEGTTKKYYKTKDGERREYEDYTTFYKIYFTEKWILNVEDYSELFGCKLTNIAEEWMGSDEVSLTELSPNFGDYGDVDRDQLRGEIKRIIKNYNQSE